MIIRKGYKLFKDQHGFIILALSCIICSLIMIKSVLNGNILYFSQGNLLGGATVRGVIPGWSSYIMLFFGILLLSSSAGIVIKRYKDIIAKNNTLKKSILLEILKVVILYVVSISTLLLVMLYYLYSI